jgi:hypothetical protein
VPTGSDTRRARRQWRRPSLSTVTTTLPLVAWRTCPAIRVSSVVTTRGRLRLAA